MTKFSFWKFEREQNFADVTLACEDCQQVEAHKVILAGQVLFDRLFYCHHHTNNIGTIESWNVSVGEVPPLHSSRLKPGKLGPSLCGVKFATNRATGYWAPERFGFGKLGPNPLYWIILPKVEDKCQLN